ncbi:DegT/DnrJ/EryC1/StrS family aminotransferase [Thiocapsa imhoffii]|uniref:DegT/DnrJ/EryC1/StrS family aminotransferase n=1 Tax=Thiocapsa imhoffii TaxID=382777 RepID=UPI0030B8C8CB
MRRRRDLTAKTPPIHSAVAITTVTLGRLGTRSFNGNKTIITGGGGAILTDDTDLARRAKHLTTTAKGRSAGPTSRSGSASTNGCPTQRRAWLRPTGALACIPGLKTSALRTLPRLAPMLPACERHLQAPREATGRCLLPHRALGSPLQMELAKAAAVSTSSGTHFRPFSGLRCRCRKVRKTLLALGYTPSERPDRRRWRALRARSRRP